MSSKICVDNDIFSLYRYNMKLRDLKPRKRIGTPQRKTGSVKLLVDLRQMRREKGVTIRQAGTALGISPGVLCQLENGCTPSIESALRFAAFIEIPVEQIWALNGKRKP